MAINPIAILNAERQRLISQDQSIADSMNKLQTKHQELQQQRQSIRDDIRTLNDAITDLQT